MVNYHNIEKSAFRPGEYVGYGGNTVWRISRVFRSSFGNWVARPRDATIGAIYTTGLKEMSEKLLIA